MKCFLASVFCYQNCKEILKYSPNIRRVVGNNGTHESLTDVQIRVSVHEKKKTPKHFKISSNLMFNTFVKKLINVNPEVRINQGFKFSWWPSSALKKHAWCFVFFRWRASVENTRGICLKMTRERCKHESEMSLSFCHSGNMVSRIIILHLPLLDTSPRNNSMLEKLVNYKLNCSKSRQTWKRNSSLS